MNSDETKSYELDGINMEENEGEEENEDWSEDLDQEKKKINEFNVEGNQALNQAFIQTLNLKVKYTPQSEKVKERVTINRKYDLQKEQDCIDFIEKFKKGDYLAVAIILCTFEAVAVSELPWLMDHLVNYLPDFELDENEQKYHYNSYIALDTILQMINAQRLITEDGQLCISLGINTIQPLQNIWQNFLMLRKAIISWLIDIAELQKYNTVFEAYQVTAAFTKVVLLDVRTAEQQIFPILCKNPGNACLLGNLLFQLYQQGEQKGYWDEIIFKWARKKNSWHWKSSYLVYALFIEHNIVIENEVELQKLFANRICMLKKSDINFILAFLFLSSKVRTAFCKILSIAYGNVEGKEEIVLKYLSILKMGFYRVNSSKVEIPLLVCDTNEQQVYLKCIISHIMKRYYLKKQLYSILQSYIREISCYNYSDRVAKYLAAFFYNMASAEEENIEEIIFFLRECGGQLAQNIAQYFWKTYQRRRKVQLT